MYKLFQLSHCFVKNDKKIEEEYRRIKESEYREKEWRRYVV
jgi:hypothetical protein